jgi:inosine/xanthosine triphosphatase
LSNGCAIPRLSDVRKVAVGTRNAPKIEAVRSAFLAYTEDVEVKGHRVSSGVSEQPVGFREIVDGARNRARAAREREPCDLAVGIEDGLIEIPELSGQVLNIGAAVVSDGIREGLGFSSAFAYPPGCVESSLASREPIGGLFDSLWQEQWQEQRQEERQEQSGEPSALSVGNIGKLSLGVLPRSEYGRHAVLCALVGFLHPALYGDLSDLPGPTSGMEDSVSESSGAYGHE